MNFSYKYTEKKRKNLSSRSIKKDSSIRVWVLRIVVYVVLLFIAVIGFTGVGAVKGLIETAPEVSESDIEPTGYATTIYDSDGNEIEKLSTDGTNREDADISEISDYLKWAFIDIEDERFYEHNGIDIKGIIRAFYVGISTGDFSEGASTLTQQLLKNNVFESGGWETNTGSLIKRKIQEQYLALQIEEEVDKDTILIDYLNTINLGAGNYGVEAAAEYYFGKEVSELTLSECAVIAAITNNPTQYNPVTYPEQNAERRALILEKMLENGHITQEEYDEAMADDVYSRIQATTSSSSTVYSYFVDALITSVSEDLADELGYSETQIYNALYSGGLSIYSTQNSTIQSIVEEEMCDESNFTAVDVSYSISWAWSVQSEDGTVTNYDESSIKLYRKAQGESNYTTFDSTEEADEWIAAFKEATLQDTDTVLGESDVIYILEPQASFVIMDQYTGEVLAIVGGRGEKVASMTLNRATDSVRQPGSAFKPLAVYAAAIDTCGYTLASVIEDAPYTIQLTSTTTKTISNWWGDTYRGLSTVLEGIQDSMNVLACKVMDDIGPSLGYQYLLKFGFTTLTSDDINTTLALGGITNGVTNLELTAAYAAIANGGVYLEPILYTTVVDSDGNVLLDATETQETTTVISETTADLLTIAMEAVVEKGTSTACQFGSMAIAGKSGTTSDSYDLWFAGYTPYLTASVWSGYDDNATISSTSSYHKQLWATIMEEVHDALGYEDTDFTYSDDIVAVDICTESGLLPVTGLCDSDPAGSTIETYYFASGTEPTETCNVHTLITICTVSGKVATSACPTSLTTEVVYRIVPSLSGSLCTFGDSMLSGSITESFSTTESAYAITEAMMEDTCTIHISSSDDTDDEDTTSEDDSTTTTTSTTSSDDSSTD